MSLKPDHITELEHAIGEALVNTAYALAYGIGEYDAGRPVQDADEEIEECVRELDILREAAHAAEIKFSDAAFQHGIFILSERLGPNFNYTVLETLVNWALKWYEKKTYSLRRSEELPPISLH